MRNKLTLGLIQRGFSTIAVLAGLAIIGISSVGVARYSIDVANRSVGTGTGIALDQVNQAVGTYVFNNQFALLAGSSIPNGSGTVANPRSPTIAELQSLVGFNGNFTQLAGNGGSYVVSISNIPSGCLGSSCNLKYQTYINRPYLDDNGGYFGKLIEAAITASPGTVGSSTPEDPTIVRGGNWTVSNPVGTTTGILMAVGGTGSSIFNQFVKLGDARDPGLRGNLTVSGSASVNTLTVTTTAVVGKVRLTDLVAVGNRCSDNALAAPGAADFALTGTMSRDAAGISLSCQSGVWQGQGLGYSQNWQDVSSVRSAGANYINATNRPITANVSFAASNGTTSVLCAYANLVLAGCTGGTTSGDGNQYGAMSISIPPGNSYSFVTGGYAGIYSWAELR